jgi:tRNA pseudouridine32 synthase/23S rRNA pseudouridine746 synthase
LVEGGPEEMEGRIDLPLAKRSDDPRSWWMKTDPAGAPSLTLFRVLGRAQGQAWLELKPVTGRTHQLRVHCAAMGWPIRGDAIYGQAGRDGPGLQLHARNLRLPLYPKREAIAVEAPAPAHMRRDLEACGLAPAGS